MICFLLNRIFCNVPAVLSVMLLIPAMSVDLVQAGSHSLTEEDSTLPYMTPEQMDGVRAKIKKYSSYTDEKIRQMMALLPNESGTLSDAETTGEIGLLVLAHGFHGEGFNQFKQAFAKIIDKYPTAYGFGLAIMDSNHLQEAVDRLEAVGATTIILMPASTAENSTMVRQWQFIFGTIDEPSYLDVPRVESESRFVWAPNPMRHPIMGEIMRDHAKAVSTDAANELVIALGHGPSETEDNDKELAILEKHADFVKRDAGFSDVKVANVQDDAPDEMRAANVEKIRGWITEAKNAGKEVIVITTVLTEASVLRKLEKDVADLGVIFNDTGLMMHPRFTDWLDEAINQSMMQLN